MADVKLVTKFVDLGSTGGQFFALYGFRNIGGTMEVLVHLVKLLMVLQIQPLLICIVLAPI